MLPDTRVVTPRYLDPSGAFLPVIELIRGRRRVLRLSALEMSTLGLSAGVCTTQETGKSQLS